METSAASRLCTSCGMCCSGVLFEIVRLQPADSIKELEKLGMQISRRKTEPYFKQPCRFLEDCTCQIYTQRPTRCRRFECSQLKQLAAGKITEQDAQAKIQQALNRVDHLHALLAGVGDLSVEDSLNERVERVLANQPNQEIDEQMQSVKSFLNRHFRELED